ncbi:hypothetical protein CHELA40_12479 [Chelatococcus asaccharovorans]|nr:hypothetical protein CHELA40_12479 [Chelatococcus asaccharovorans]CAH1682546.1 hypothetical protein CHELA17_63130 [Chelatococcus asaccharovorans]
MVLIARTLAEAKVVQIFLNAQCIILLRLPHVAGGSRLLLISRKNERSGTIYFWMGLRFALDTHFSRRYKLLSALTNL